jgi:hypothetical protein
MLLVLLSAALAQDLDTRADGRQAARQDVGREWKPFVHGAIAGTLTGPVLLGSMTAATAGWDTQHQVGPAAATGVLVITTSTFAAPAIGWSAYPLSAHPDLTGDARGAYFRTMRRRRAGRAMLGATAGLAVGAGVGAIAVASAGSLVSF